MQHVSALSKLLFIKSYRSSTAIIVLLLSMLLFFILSSGTADACHENCDEQDADYLVCINCGCAEGCTGDDAGGTWRNHDCTTKTVDYAVCPPAVAAPCQDVTWTPSPSNVCEGTAYQQTSNCGNTQSATGTKTTDECFIPSGDTYPAGCLKTQAGLFTGVYQNSDGSTFTDLDTCSCKNDNPDGTSSQCSAVDPGKPFCKSTVGPCVECRSTEDCDLCKCESGAENGASCWPLVQCNSQNQCIRTGTKVTGQCSADAATCNHACNTYPSVLTIQKPECRYPPSVSQTDYGERTMYCQFRSEYSPKCGYYQRGIFTQTEVCSDSLTCDAASGCRPNCEIGTTVGCLYGNYCVDGETCTQCSTSESSYCDGNLKVTERTYVSPCSGSYEASRVNCPYGCSGGNCNPPPCAGAGASCPGGTSDCCAGAYCDADYTRCVICGSNNIQTQPTSDYGGGKCEADGGSGTACFANALCDEQSPSSALAQGFCDAQCKYIDYDISEPACEAGSYNWFKGGESAGFGSYTPFGSEDSCCGDDAGEYAKEFVSEEATLYTACCNAATDCGDTDGSCVADSVASADKERVCFDGAWFSIHGSDAACAVVGGVRGLVGEPSGSSISQLKNDGSVGKLVKDTLRCANRPGETEFFLRTRQCAAASGCTSDLTDKAVCDKPDDCVYSRVCYSDLDAVVNNDFVGLFTRAAVWVGSTAVSGQPAEDWMTEVSHDVTGDGIPNYCDPGEWQGNAVGTLTGNVGNATGSSVEGAVVRLLGTSYAATADTSGNYIITNIAEGTYDIVANKPGQPYEDSSEIGFAIDGFGTYEQDFTLVHPLLDCFDDCTKADGLCRAECHGKGLCAFSSATTAAACDYATPGLVDYDNAGIPSQILCCTGNVFAPVKASVDVCGENVISLRRPVLFKGKLVTMVVTVFDAGKCQN
ncbi:carboxypeptidase regulatory-like domain-containing protein [Candidatus Woesearchaeota archaeon]|nr:carboxypeptidase regulatory-like domain-containing protein [Candidatus Woesearchaeota archaeon]